MLNDFHFRHSILCNRIVSEIFVNHALKALRKLNFERKVTEDVGRILL